MKNKAWEKVEQIFHTALNLSFEDRYSYLQRECAGDVALYSEVQSLLHNFEKDSGFLAEPVFKLGLEAINDKSTKNLSGSIIGYYELQEKIGAGGMGEVYKAVDIRLNRLVALKFLRESLENDNAANRRLIKEAQAIAMLEHPNICAIHGIEQSDKHHFIVMQYLEGETLAEGINHLVITIENFKLFARQIVTAVAFAHSHGIIHRDLKPGNMMLSGEGQIKVLDFGLAKVVPQEPLLDHNSTNEMSQFSQKGMIIGTVSYMSPEQLRGEKLDYQSDIFSLGIVLYELIAKQNPFARKSQAETIAAVLGNEPPPLKEIAPDFPQILTNLVEKCLRKNKEDRFRSTAEMLVELDKAESANTREATSKFREGFFFKAAFAALILLAIWAGVFFYIAKPQRRILAVLPISFENPPIEKEYLAGGLTQGIIDKLSGLSDLQVKNEYFTNRYKEKITEPQIVGKELNADVVFTGAIIQRGSNLYLTTKLTRISDNLIMDANEWKIEETNLIDLQEIVSARIVGNIKSKLTDEDKNKLAKKDTDSAEAKRLYDLGRFHLKRRKESDDIIKAVEYFSDAKDLDPNFAKSWAGLANAYIASSLPGVKGAITPEKAFGYAKEAANKSLKLDTTLSESHYSLGLINSKYEWKWAEAEGYFRTAISLSPEFIPARVGLINLLGIQGRLDESLEEARKIKEVDPLSIVSDLEIAKTYYRKRDYQQTNLILSDLLERFPDNKGIQYIRIYQFLNTGKLKEAAEVLEKMYKSDNQGDKVFAAAPLGFAYAKMGRRDEALKIIKDLDGFKENNYVPAQEKALIYVGLKDYDKVFENLDKSCIEKFQTLPGWVSDPIVDEVKSDPRFAEIRKCVNL